MRSFSNIMTNFAGNLHLLVDSIGGATNCGKIAKKTEKVWWYGEKSVPLQPKM